MPQNTEIKARVRDLKAIERGLTTSTPDDVLLQEDTFFRSDHGRLKLRKLGPDRGELIFYERPDATGPKTSHYSIHRTDDPDGLRDTLAEALEVTGEVRKRRRLFLVGQTRVHLDEVEGLGDFIELEVVLREDQDPEEGEHIARELMARLGVDEEDLVAGAYVDLLD